MVIKGKGIVVNTCPWISLSICGQISLLERLYHGVYIPMGVRDEIMAGVDRVQEFVNLKDHHG